MERPWGVVSRPISRRDFADADERLAAYGRMKERVRHAFRRFAELLPPREGNIRLLGTSGTVTTLASVHLALPSYDRRAVDGLMMPVDSMRAVNHMLSRMSFAERAELPCIGAERADLVVAGCAILEATWTSAGADLGVAARGIRWHPALAHGQGRAPLVTVSPGSERKPEQDNTKARKVWSTKWLESRQLNVPMSSGHGEV